ncbi:protein phosphatase [Pseudomonas sp. B14-6]|nr:protein phosphatase [Pseudomonas sp. B14-6]QKG65798.1 protein phosphatase [Pseudomonas sp. B14-6]
MQQHPYSVLPLAQLNGQLIFTPQRLTEGKTIAIHCKGGSGRTGLVAAQRLIESGVPFSDAIRDVQSLRPRAIQHPAHIEYIGQFDTQSNSH